MCVVALASQGFRKRPSLRGVKEYYDSELSKAITPDSIRSAPILSTVYLILAITQKNLRIHTHSLAIRLMKLYTSGFALVTGAGQGVDNATALSFAESGLRGLVLAGRTPAPLHATALERRAVAENADFDVLVVPTDISIEESVKNLMKTAVDHFGRVDYCANVGGVSGLVSEGYRTWAYSFVQTMGTKTKFSSTPTEDWLAIQQTNINGIFWLVREQISVMEKQERPVKPITSPKRPAERGSIVVLSVAAAVIALPDGGTYTHTKYATNSLTKATGTSHSSPFDLVC